MRAKHSASKFTILFLISLTLSLTVGCGAGGSHTLPTQPEGWDIQHSSSMPSHPSSVSDGVWAFDFPHTGSVNYVTTPFTPQGTPKAITMTFKVTYDPGTIFDYKLGDATNVCTTPAQVVLYFQRQGDKGDLDHYGYRWWFTPTQANQLLSNASGEEVTITAPFDPAAWSNVVGYYGNANEDNTRYFNDAIKEMGHVGLTFGGGCFYGHGVRVNVGNAKFTLVKFSVT